ncbi:MAG: tetratricopeptide repeat protein [Pseudonocardiaceae bacterium]
MQAALTATEQAVEICRRLVAVNPVGFEPGLATVLTNLGKQLLNVGRPQDALVATEQAVQIYRRWSVEHPAAVAPALAMALNNRGMMLSALGRPAQALTATEEAVQIRRQLAAGNLAVFESDLAMSLNNLGVQLSKLGRTQDALAATEQAVEAYRRLATADPAAFGLAFARGLYSFAWVRVTAQTELAQARAAAEESIVIHKTLLDQSPMAFVEDLSDALSELIHMLDEFDRSEECPEAQVLSGEGPMPDETLDP